MPGADFLQDIHKPVSRPSRPQQRSSPIAAEGNEMKIALPVMSLERIAHPTKSAPLKPKGAAPRLSPSVNYTSGMLSQCATVKRKVSVRHPPKTDVAMVNEVLCKVLCHNLVVLIHETQELGIDPMFWSKAA
jgi:hypothetical protein